MLKKYRLFQRANGVFYCQDKESSKQRSLRTKARPIENLPEGNRRAALDALSEICPKKVSIVNLVRAWKQLSIDLAQRRAARVIRPLTARMRIASPQKRLSQSI